MNFSKMARLLRHGLECFFAAANWHTNPAPLTVKGMGLQSPTMPFLLFRQCSCAVYQLLHLIHQRLFLNACTRRSFFARNLIMRAAGLEMHPTCTALKSTSFEHPAMHSSNSVSSLSVCQLLHDLQAPFWCFLFEFDDRLNSFKLVMHIVLFVLKQRPNALRSNLIDLFMPLISFLKGMELLQGCFSQSPLVGTMLGGLILMPPPLLASFASEQLCRHMQGEEPLPFRSFKVVPQVSHQNTSVSLLQDLPPSTMWDIDLVSANN